MTYTTFEEEMDDLADLADFLSLTPAPETAEGTRARVEDLNRIETEIRRVIRGYALPRGYHEH